MSRAPEAPRGKLLPLRPPRKCPICGRRAERDTYPFCSKRCADDDLDRWLGGRYAIAGEPSGSEGDERAG